MLGVITGDLVHSSRASREQLREVQQRLQDIITSNQDRHRASGDMHRGDGFQLAFYHPFDAFVCAVDISCQLAMIKWQASLSIAVADGHLNQPVGRSHGPVFQLSGRQLEVLPRGQWRFSSSDSELEARLSMATQLIGHILSQLSPRQGEVISYWLNHQRCEQKQIADALQMTPQNVSLHWRKGAGNHLEDYLDNVARLLQPHTGDVS